MGFWNFLSLKCMSLSLSQIRSKSRLRLYGRHSTYPVSRCRRIFGKLGATGRKPAFLFQAQHNYCTLLSATYFSCFTVTPIWRFNFTRDKSCLLLFFSLELPPLVGSVCVSRNCTSIAMPRSKHFRTIYFIYWKRYRIKIGFQNYNFSFLYILT